MNSFYQDIIKGLKQPHKKLSSKYFYDTTGDQLFQDIMQMEEYYLPKCEREIIAEQTPAIGKIMAKSATQWDVVELGAGDGSKTVNFLKLLKQSDIQFSYLPLDISPNVLEINRENVHKELPNLPITPISGDYFHTFPEIAQRNAAKLLLFMGSNIGNFQDEDAVSFLRKIKGYMNPEDLMLVAFDLRKNPHTILSAYNDSKGITKQFNLNILHRINHELKANFDVAAFDHYPFYEPISGITYSYLVSLEKQEVSFPDGETIYLVKNECIHTEISKKYSFLEINSLATEANFNVLKIFTDTKEYYSLALLRAAQ